VYKKENAFLMIKFKVYSKLAQNNV